MDKSKAVESSKSCEKVESDQPSISLPTDLVGKIRRFIALANNLLMTIPVEGNQVLKSAEVMNLAIELHEKLEGVKSE